MSSILTNTSAMVALQTLRGVNAKLSMTQNEISTGKSVGSAKDSASIWAISKVMESDVNGFKGIYSPAHAGLVLDQLERMRTKYAAHLIVNNEITAMKREAEKAHLMLRAAAAVAQIIRMASAVTAP